MASKLRTPALVVALIAAVLVILVEMGSSFRASAGIFEGLGDRLGGLRDSISGLGSSDAESPVQDFGDLESLLATDSAKMPGLAVASLIHLDVLLMTTLLLFNLPLVLPPARIAQVQGFVSVILGIVTILLGLLTILKAMVNLFLMLGMLLAIPFGTIVYMIQYASFDTTKAEAIIATLMFLKCVVAATIVLAHERFLLNFGFIALVATSFIAMIIISFLHNFPPSFLVSITDSVGAIVVSVLAIVWGIIYIVGGILSIITMLRGLLV